MKCEFCGVEHDVERHHIMPKISGGSDDENNMLDLCFKCHKLVHKLGIFDADTINSIKELGIAYYFINEYACKYVDNRDINKLDFNTLTAFCDFMLEKVAYSQSSHSILIKKGMENAKAKGKEIGRPVVTKDNIPSIFYKHYALYKNKSLSVSEFARLCDMSRTTIYKYIGMVEDNK